MEKIKKRELQLKLLDKIFSSIPEDKINLDSETVLIHKKKKNKKN